MRETEELAHLDREIERLLRRRLELVAGPESGSTGYDQCRRAMEAARCPVSQPRVVYQGVAGAYSEMAALTFFGKEARCQGLARFEDVFEAVHRGEADYAVLPIENSSTGAIRQVYELLTQYQHYIVGEDTVRVEHCLMAPRGASLDTITQIYSHEQGLFQSDRFLSRHPEWEQIPFGDTAGSAQYVAQTGDITKAAIGSARAAELYAPRSGQDRRPAFRPPPGGKFAAYFDGVPAPRAQPDEDRVQTHAGQAVGVPFFHGVLRLPYRTGDGGGPGGTVPIHLLSPGTGQLQKQPDRGITNKEESRWPTLC